MSITSSSVLVDGTVATTGGTATGVIVKDTNNPFVCVLNDASEFIDQTLIKFSTKEPYVDSSAPNGYTQKRSEVYVSVPLALDNGNYTKNTLRITLSVDHETTDAEVQSMLVLGAQLLHDTDFSDFWKKQARD